MTDKRIPGREAAEKKGRFKANKWLLLRRLSQLSILGLFLLGPLAGIWIIRGTLSASMTLDFLPLTDPLILLQSLAAGHAVTASAVIGALIAVIFYAAVGGRIFCAWVCPVNPVTDAAAWVNRRLGITRSLNIHRSTRYWLTGFILVLAAATGTVVWEHLNPVTMLHRGLLFGMGMGWFLIGAVAVFDVFVMRHGWCGYLCPVGALYSLLGFVSVLRVKAVGRGKCTDCMDCFAVCPEPQVIQPALKGDARSSAVILSNNCLNCGRCIDVCPHNVFCFSRRS